MVVTNIKIPNIKSLALVHFHLINGSHRLFLCDFLRLIQRHVYKLQNKTQIDIFPDMTRVLGRAGSGGGLTKTVEDTRRKGI